MPRMTRKHFQTIADALCEAHPSNYLPRDPDVLSRYEAQERAWWRVVNQFRADLRASNPRFDGDRFTDACLPSDRS